MLALASVLGVGEGHLLHRETRWVGSRYFAKSESLFQSFLRHKRFREGYDPIDRYHRMSLMIDILSGPKAFLKAGLVTEAELASVPLTLKRWALWPYRLADVCIIEIIVWEVWRRWCDIPIP
ncbi:hypothetical protein [Pseudomonas lactis]|uniref:hypothetical protein n=1 Tax=Pseudomonas lactis TaxID=1615674 RepID=UPI001F178A88|nr:hypothetical protein [Pseudomonas lactis]